MDVDTFNQPCRTGHDKNAEAYDTIWTEFRPPELLGDWGRIVIKLPRGSEASRSVWKERLLPSHHHLKADCKGNFKKNERWDGRKKPSQNFFQNPLYNRQQMWYTVCVDATKGDWQTKVAETRLNFEGCLGNRKSQALWQLNLTTVLGFLPECDKERLR